MGPQRTDHTMCFPAAIEFQIYNHFLTGGYDPWLPNRAIFVVVQLGETCLGRMITPCAMIMPSTPWLGEDVATSPMDQGRD